jgi:hypothetical protein
MLSHASKLVIPGREPCDKIDASINFALGERAQNPSLPAFLRHDGFRARLFEAPRNDEPSCLTGQSELLRGTAYIVASATRMPNRKFYLVDTCIQLLVASRVCITHADIEDGRVKHFDSGDYPQAMRRALSLIDVGSRFMVMAGFFGCRLQLR